MKAPEQRRHPAGTRIAAWGRRGSYVLGLLTASYLITFTAQGKAIGPTIAVAGIAAVAWAVTLLPAPLWAWRMARLLAAASASTAGLLLSTTLGVTLARSDISKEDSALVTYLTLTALLGAVGMWTADLRIAHHESIEADARHAEILVAISEAQRPRLVHRRPYSAIAWTLIGGLLIAARRRRR